MVPARGRQHARKWGSPHAPRALDAVTLHSAECGAVLAAEIDRSHPHFICTRLQLYEFRLQTASLLSNLSIGWHEHAPSQCSRVYARLVKIQGSWLSSHGPGSYHCCRLARQQIGLFALQEGLQVAFLQRTRKSRHSGGGGKLHTRQTSGGHPRRSRHCRATVPTHQNEANMHDANGKSAAADLRM